MSKLQDFLNLPVSVSAPSVRGGKAGDLFGVELECEGINVIHDGSMDILADWAPHNDGSLRPYRGHPACEWVFNGPANYKASVDRVGKLFKYFKKAGAKLHCSNRTSCHVHFNMSDKTTYQLINTFILFTILEDVLDSYCGEDRRGNVFCLSARYAEGQVKWVEDSCFNHFRFKLNENWRYCSLNLASLHKFGTIEFRGMRGLDTEEEVLSWLSILNDLVNYSCYKMGNPVKLIEDISVKTPLGFIQEVFSHENAAKLTKNLDPEFIHGSVYEGLRLVQMLCYKIGTEFDQVRLRGKDFWASFADDEAKAERDFAPEDFVPPGAKPARQGGGLFRRPPLAEEVRVNMAQPRVVPVMPAPHQEAPLPPGRIEQDRLNEIWNNLARQDAEHEERMAAVREAQAAARALARAQIKPAPRQAVLGEWARPIDREDGF